MSQWLSVRSETREWKMFIFSLDSQSMPYQLNVECLKLPAASPVNSVLENQRVCIEKLKNLCWKNWRPIFKGNGEDWSSNKREVFFLLSLFIVSSLQIYWLVLLTLGVCLLPYLLVFMSIIHRHSQSLLSAK